MPRKCGPRVFGSHMTETGYPFLHAKYEGDLGENKNPLYFFED